MLRSALRFGFVGLLNTLVGLAVIAALLQMGAGDYPANAGGYVVGLCLSFTLNRIWTFEVRGPVAAGEAARFLVAFAIAYSANLAVLTGMRGLGFERSLVGQGAGIVTYSICFFLLSRAFVFVPGRAAR